MAGDLSKPMTYLKQIWETAKLDGDAIKHLVLTGDEPALPSSFHIGTAAQVSISAAALAAAEVRHARGLSRQTVELNMRHATTECSNYLSLDGVVPEVWDKFSGVYPCGPQGKDGWIRIHANFKHHREGALQLLGCSTDESTTKADVTKALESWTAKEFELAADKAGLVAAALRTFDEWDQHPQSGFVNALPLFSIERIGDAPPNKLAPLDSKSRPLSGVRVLDLTRVLAGPVGGRTLAAYGAEVMLINSPNLPNMEVIAETSRGKLSVHLDLQTEKDKTSLENLIRQGHIIIQGYRPGSLAKLGFGPERAAELRPGIIYVSLSTYGNVGPWAEKRGFESIVQTATGFNHAEGSAAGTDQPKALPAQIIDHASGYLMAFGAQAALVRQMREGGSWHVKVSLAQTANWLRSMGRLPQGLYAPKVEIEPYLETYESGFGKLVAVGHSVRFSETPAYWSRPSMPPGSHPPVWP